MANSITMKQHRVQRMKTHSFVKTAIKVNCILFCTLLCVTHLILISIYYFKFRTIALFAPYIPFEQTLPFVTICVKLPSEPVGMNESWNSTLTVTEIHPSSILQRCEMRNFTSKHVEPIECSDGFETTRTIRKRVYYCYAIKPRVMTTYMILEAAAVLNNRRVIYKFLLSDLFNKHKQLMPLMYFRRRPENEFHFSRSIQLGEREGKNVSFEIGYELIEIFRLPPPFETNCIDGSICLDREGKRHSWCRRALCINNATLTHGKQQETVINGIFMEVNSIASPSIRVSYAPEKRTSSFILEVLSLLTIWISFSINMASRSLISYVTKSKSRTMKLRKKRMVVHSKLGLNASRIQSNTQCNSHHKCSQLPAGGTRAASLCKFLLRMVVLCFFTRESCIMSMNYFKYKTHVFIHIRSDAIDAYPSISHCIDIYEWFNYEQPCRFYQSFDRSMTQFFTQFNCTLKQIFQLTPPVESAMDRCQVRHSRKTPLVTTTDCNQYFSVTKFYYGEFMCYNFEPKVQFIQPVDFEHDISVIFSIMLADKLVPRRHYQTIVSYGMPSQSRLLAQEQWRHQEKLLIDLAFRTFRHKQLPAPYDTHCGQYEHSSQCESRCMNLRKIDLISFSHISTEPIDVPVMDYADLKNDRIAEFVERAQERCKNACPKPCDNSFIDTVKRESESNYTHQVTLLSPKYPILYFHAHPTYPMYDYIYQLACSASFWIGMSIVGSVTLLAKFGICDKASPAPSTSQESVMLFTRAIKQIDSSLIHAPITKVKCFKKKMTRRLKKLLFITLLTSGFCFHTFITASVYFEYPTRMDTRMSYNENHTQLKMTVCISIDQLDLRGDYSLHNIWAESPAPDQFLVECGYRGLQIPQLSHLPNNLMKRVIPYINSTSLCNSLLRVKKFSTLGLICYEVRPGESSIDTEYRTQYQIGDTGVYEYFILSPRASSYNLTISLSQGPSTNALFLPTTAYHTRSSSVCVYYYVNYEKYRITSLPHPYDMGVYDSLKRITCMRNCLGPKMRNMKVFSPYDTVSDASFLQHETETHSIRPKSMHMKKECEKMCKYKRHFKVMNDVYFDTHANGPYNWALLKRWNGTISIWSMTSNYLVTETTFYPEFRFFDLVVFVGSLFSVWFGQSVLQLVDLFLKKVILT